MDLSRYSVIASGWIWTWTWIFGFHFKTDISPTFLLSMSSISLWWYPDDQHTLPLLLLMMLCGFKVRLWFPPYFLIIFSARIAKMIVISRLFFKHSGNWITPHAAGEYSDVPPPPLISSQTHQLHCHKRINIRNKSNTNRNSNRCNWVMLIDEQDHYLSSS